MRALRPSARRDGPRKERRRTAGVRGQQMGQLVAVGLVGAGGSPGALQLVERGISVSGTNRPPYAPKRPARLAARPSVPRAPAASASSGSTSGGAHESPDALAILVSVFAFDAARHVDTGWPGSEMARATFSGVRPPATNSSPPCRRGPWARGTRRSSCPIPPRGRRGGCAQLPGGAAANPPTSPGAPRRAGTWRRGRPRAVQLRSLQAHFVHDAHHLGQLRVEKDAHQGTARAARPGSPWLPARSRAGGFWRRR